MQGHENTEHRVEREVVAFQVHELVLEDESCLRWSEGLVEFAWKEQRGPQQAGNGRTADAGGDPDTRNALQTDFAGDLSERGA
jgi:hypothetical protein